MKLFRRKKRKDAPEENPEPLAETVAVKKPVKTKKKKEPAAEAEGKSSSSVAKKKSEPAKTVAAPEMVKEKESVIKKLKKKVEWYHKRMVADIMSTAMREMTTNR